MRGGWKDFQAYLNNIARKGQDWTVFSRQSARLRQLWLESGSEIPPDEADKHFLEGSLSGGWVLQGDGGKVHNLLTDSEIFGWGRPQVRRRAPVYPKRRNWCSAT